MSKKPQVDLSEEVPVLDVDVTAIREAELSAIVEVVVQQHETTRHAVSVMFDFAKIACETFLAAEKMRNASVRKREKLAARSRALSALSVVSAAVPATAPAEDTLATEKVLKKNVSSASELQEKFKNFKEFKKRYKNTDTDC